MRYIILLLISLLAASVTQAQTYNNPAPIMVPATGTTSGIAAPYPSNITVSGFSGTVTKATVTLTNISHTFPDDIDILLVSPGGQTVILMSDTGDFLDLINVTLTFDDAAATMLPDATQIVSGTYQPTNFGAGDAFPAPAPVSPYGTTLAVFNGTNPNGTWSLYVVDDLGGDSGSITGGWSLTLQSMTTAASVSIGGRVLTANGRGISRARVLLTGATGETRMAISNPFGFYRFEEVPAGETYVFSVIHKRYQFAPQVVFLTEENDGFNFIAQQ